MDRQLNFALLMFLSVSRITSAQIPADIPNNAAPQSARQTLLEMIFAVEPSQFFSHLPKHAQPLMKADVNILPLEDFSQAVTQLRSPGRKLETFETGPILLRSEDPYSRRTVEVSVESKTDGIDEDQLQLSLRLYRNGKPEPLPFVPAATFTMKIERGIWCLDDVALNLHVPLGDDAFLDSLHPDRRPPEVEEFETVALNHLRMVNTAEVSYASTFPELGFACSMTYLGGADVDEPTSSSAGLLDAGLSSGTLDGYTFSIENCSGNPVDHYSVSAVPDNPQMGLRAFCSDESAAIRFSEDGKAATCLTEGEPPP